jgi:HEAT repeat protein
MVEDTDRLIDDLRNNRDWMERRRAARLLGKQRGTRVRDALIGALDDRDDDVRQAAILALGQIGDPVVMEHIFKHKIYHASNPDVRWAANYTLAKLQGRGDTRVIEELLKAVEDPEWIVRNAASDALMKQIQYLARDTDPDCIRILLRVLAASSYDIHERVVEVLTERGATFTGEYIEALFSISENVRAGAAQVLGALGEKRAVSPLRKLLLDESKFVRLRAAEALGALQAQESVHSLISILGDVDPRVRRAAVKALCGFAKSAVEPLLLAYRYSKRKVQRRAILETLGQLTDPRAVPALIDAMGDSHHMVRMAAIRAISTMGGSEVTGRLIELLSKNEIPIDKLLEDAKSHPFLNVRIRAIRTLGELKDSGAVDTLKELSADDDQQIAVESALALEKIGLDMWRRGGAIFCLGTLGSTRAVPPIIDCLTDPNRDIRVEAARALGLLRDRRAAGPLVKCLSDPDTLLRIEAIRVLANIGAGNPDVVPAIIERLKDESHDVRSEAAKALGRIADCSALPALVGALEDEYWSVQRDVRNSIDNLNCLIPKE